MSIVNSFLHFMKNAGHGQINSYFLNKFSHHHDAPMSGLVCKSLQASANNNNHRAVSTFEFVPMIKLPDLKPQDMLPYLLDNLFDENLGVVNHKKRLNKLTDHSLNTNQAKYKGQEGIQDTEMEDCEAKGQGPWITFLNGNNESVQNDNIFSQTLFFQQKMLF